MGRSRILYNFVLTRGRLVRYTPLEVLTAWPMKIPADLLRTAATSLLLSSLAPVAKSEEEIGFIENFALAEDRAKVLKTLIPGTEDYYYYHALHAQNGGDFAAVEQVLEPWVKRYGETQRVWEIRHRQALLRYDADPKGTLAYLQRHLGLNFGHQREVLGAKPQFPTAIDPAQVTWEAYLNQAFAHSGTVNAVADSGLDRILRGDIQLDPQRLRDLLGRLRYPDYPRLVGLVAADLRTEFSRGFGEFEIHRLLLPEQLDELARLHPALANHPEYVNTRLRQLQPSPDTDWTRDRAAREAYLTRLWDAVKGLNPSFNSLKAHVLYQRLQHHHRLGDYPRELFLEYLKLPRHLPYVEPRYIQQDPDRLRFPVDLNADFRPVTACPPIAADEPLVRDYLLHFFVGDQSWVGFAAYIREPYLKTLFAEAKLTNGVAGEERWFSYLAPGEVQALKDRIDIEFAPGNAETFAPGDPVKLDVFVKNAGKLLVKVYEINTLNYCLDQKRDLNTDIDLDGLTPNEETAHEFSEAPIRRVRREFTFDSLAGKRGAWVIEFIGNGRSSRAVVRKGRLQYLSEITAAGLAVTVLGEDNQPAKKPSIWFGGREYRPDPESKSGTIILPFSNQPGPSQIVLTDGDFATLENLDVPAENYSLEAGFHIDRENLLPGRKATLAVRPDFRVNGQPASAKSLQKVKLVVRSIDRKGTESVTEVPDFKLFDDRESLHEIRVPERLMGLNVELRAQIEKLSEGGKTIDLTTSHAFSLNGIDNTGEVAELHLSQIGGEFFLEALGKTGEPLADRAVSVSLKHRDFNNPMQFTLKTNQQGRIGVTTLLDQEQLSAHGDGFRQRTWNLADFRAKNRVPASLHAKAGEIVRLPFSAAELAPGALALLETRAGLFVADALPKASLKDGVIEVAGLAPGDYVAYLRGSAEKIDIRVTASQAEYAGYALAAWRHLEIKNPKPLQIASIDTRADKLVLRLVNADPLTRVHLAATRFLPDYPLGSLGRPNVSEPIAIRRGSSEALYLSGRDIGEEYRYILERRAAKKFPGNLTPRPDLLLNPWALRDTATAIDEAEIGEEYQKKQDAAMSERAAAKSAADPVEQNLYLIENITPNLNFLRDQAPIVFNLVPDENGLVTIDRKDLGDRQHVHVLAVNAANAAYRTLSLAEGEGTAIRDLRLTRHLDPATHFSQRQKATILRAEQSLTLPDARSSELETYDTLASVYAVLAAVNGGSEPAFAEFAFLLDWPTLPAERKREQYSKYACHELNFFLSRKDPAFFAETVRPFLANKRHKTFMDEYLIGADLAKYAQPWNFGRLNTVERILLGRRLGGAEPAAVARSVREQLALIPVDPGQTDHFFYSALRGKAMLGDALGLNVQGSGSVFVLGNVVNVNGAVMETGGNLRLGVPADRMARGLRDEAKKMAVMDALPAPMSAPVAAPAAPAPGAVAGGGFAAVAQRKATDKETELLAKSELSVEKLKDLREANRALFRKLEATKEWAENNYYHLPIEQQIAELIPTSTFWRDYAAWDGQGAFHTREFPAASRNLSEMLLALSVLDLPFTAEEHEFTVEDNVLTLKAKSPVIVFHEEVEKSAVAANRPPILVSQNFFRASDRYLDVDGERTDKFVTEEFLTGVLYGAQVVATNTASSAQKLEVLLQIPHGALPAQGSDYTDSRHIRLEPYSTQRLEYFFYFPIASGDGATFPHYPVHVSKAGESIAWAEPFSFKVVDQLSALDKAGWDYLSQHGSEAEVLAFIDHNNVYRHDLSRIAWRCRESVDFFRKITAKLAGRHAWDQTLWSYGIFHGDTPTARQYLLHREDFLSQCGRWLESELVSIDPVARHWYQHLEYQPLVNARAHQLGRDRKILNDRFREQYRGYLNVLSYRPETDSADALGVAYYLFLQDRVEEALTWLAKAGPQDDGGSKLQADYLRSYAALYQEQPAEAGRIAAAYAAYPVDRWRERFGQIAAQVAEIEGAAAQPARPVAEDREAQQAALAATEANFELKAEGRNVTLDYRNLDRVRLNYYEMDLEFLFSSNPFVNEDSGRFSFVRPNVTLLKELPKNEASLTFEIPAQFANRNVLVEAVGAGKKRAVAVYANALKVQIVENYGRLDVRHADTGKPLPKAYVKVYARFNDGTVKFFKDGYTDLRGQFDYVSLNTNEIDNVERISVLIMSEKDGALVRETAPPRR
jgi:hypothetical protein